MSEANKELRHAGSCWYEERMRELEIEVSR